MSDRNGTDVELTRVGLGYELAFPEARLTLNRLRESRGEVSGELIVDRLYPAGPADGLLIYRARFNASSTTSRGTAARYLALEDSTIVEKDWKRFVEILSRQVLAEHRRGEPFVTIGGPIGEAPKVEAMILNPVIWANAATLVFGAGGIGKSTIVAGAAVSVQTGLEIVPGWRPLSGPVLVLDWEDAASEWDWQIRAICRGAGVDVPRLDYRRMAGSLADQIEEVAAHVTEHAYALVIVDSVEAACGSGHEAETYNGRAERFFDALRLLDAAKFCVDHIAGADIDRDTPLVKSIGGVRKRDRSRAVYELRRQSRTHDRTELVLRDVKANRRAEQDPRGIGIEFSDFDGDGRARCIQFTRCSVDKAQSTDAVDQIEALVLELGPRRTPEIASMIGLKANTVNQAVRRHGGRLVRLPDDRIAARARVTGQ